jgi:hypothetical protein
MEQNVLHSGLVNIAPGTLPASSNTSPPSPVEPELEPDPELDPELPPELDPEPLPPPELELVPPELEPDDAPLDPPDDDDPDPLPEDPPEEPPPEDPPLLELDPTLGLSLLPQACAPRKAATAKSGGHTTSHRIPILSSITRRATRHEPRTRMPEMQARPDPVVASRAGPHLP